MSTVPQAAVDESRVDPVGLVREVILENEEYMKRGSWHIGLAVAHVSAMAEQRRSRLFGEGLGATGTLIMGDVHKARLWGLSVQSINHIFQELARTLGAGENREMKPMSEMQLARLLKVITFHKPLKVNLLLVNLGDCPSHCSHAIAYIATT
jgi:hypothetical protein